MEDEFFRRWALQPDSETIDFWEKFCQEYPDKEVELEKARQLLFAIHQNYATTIQQVSKQQAKASFQKIAKEIKPTAKVIKINRRTWMAWTSAACVALLVAVATFLNFQTTDAQLTFTTGYGQQLPIELPDGSQVQLNANSTLYYYPENWSDKDARQVWLKGEAFFKVEKKALGTKFIVHAGEMKVAVLGTQFNVRSRGEDAEVVLAEGIVALDVANQHITMKPGDMIAYSTVKKKVAAKKVKTADYIAWKDGITVFNNTLSEVVKELAIIYGVEFSIEKEALKERKIQLSVPTNSLEQVLETLELLYPEEISISKEDDKVIIF